MLQLEISVEVEIASKKEALLTDLLPDPGYFLAGGIAGVVSRTTTAPLDRLKVYLIAQTGVTEEAVQTIKEGAPVEAVKKASRPLINASRALWRMGGVRSLFAGKLTWQLDKFSLILQGNGLNVIKVMPESAIKFGSYEVLRLCLPRCNILIYARGFENCISKT